MQFLSVLTSITALAAMTLANPVALPVPAGKPTGGPASASVTVYSGPATCADPNTVSLPDAAKRWQSQKDTETNLASHCRQCRRRQNSLYHRKRLRDRQHRKVQPQSLLAKVHGLTSCV
jgi:hypothetical protein